MADDGGDQAGAGPKRAAKELKDASSLKGALLDLVASSLVLNILALALPLGLLQVYDRILPNHSDGTLTILMLGVLVAVAMETGLTLLRSHAVEWLGARFEHKAGTAAFARLLSRGMASIESSKTGAHLERLGAVGAVRDLHSGSILVAMLDLPFAVVNLALIAMIGGPLVGVPACMLLVFAYHASRAGSSMRAALDRRHTADERRFDFLIETLSGVHSIKTMAMEAQMQRRYERLQEGCDAAHHDVALKSAGALGMSSFYSQATLLSVAAFGALLVLDGTMTTGGLAACSMLAGRILGPVQKALSSYVRLQGGLLARKRLDALYSMPGREAGILPAPSDDWSLELRGATFRPDPEGRAVIDAVDLRVEEGECVAILGANGSGRTTLLSLIQGSLEPTEGRVLVGGVDAALIEPRALRAAVAYLPQSAAIYQGTLLENISMFRPEAEAGALRAAEDLGLDQAVSTLPQGWETRVGDGPQDALPRGLRQRAAIARALVGDPKVVLFDEANAALDGAGDAALRVWIEREKGKRTLILATQRPSLLRMADRVLELREGKLVAAEKDRSKDGPDGNPEPDPKEGPDGNARGGPADGSTPEERR